MTSFGVATNRGGFFRAASLANLEQKQMMTVHGADRPLLLCWHEGRVFALDNRCPHMGFPLSKGSLHRGLLTCHWHHARFDLRSGCTFDLWADDTPVFEVCVEGDDIWVSKVPVQRADAVFHSARLRRGLEENIGLVQAKSIVALLGECDGTKSVIREIAQFHAAMSIYLDRFLNIPGAQLPSEQPLENLPTVADELRETILSVLDQRRNWLRLHKGEEVYAE